MKLHRYVDHQRLHIVTKDVISLSISVLLLFRHYISHKITFGAPSSGGVFCSACGAFIYSSNLNMKQTRSLSEGVLAIRRIFSLVGIITKPKFSSCPFVFKIGLFR